MASVRHQPGWITFPVIESLTSHAVVVSSSGHDVKSLNFILFRDKVLTELYGPAAGRVVQRRRKCFVGADLYPVCNFQMLCQMAELMNIQSCNKEATCWFITGSEWAACPPKHPTSLHQK